MIVITGGTGHVGKAVAKYLLDRQGKITIVTRDPEKAGALFDHRAAEAAIDINDVAALHQLFRSAKKVFLLNPPASPVTDTDQEERKTVLALVQALKDSPLEKIVVESTSSAQPGTNIGDLGVLYEMEESVKSLGIPSTILRPGYYMTNWLSSLKTKGDRAKLVSFYPGDLKIAMVAPADIGALAGEYLLARESPALVEIEGPQRYTPAEVAESISAQLDKPVDLEVIPPEKWETTYRDMGFSPLAAKSYTNMNRIALQGKFEMPPGTIRTTTSIDDFFSGMLAKGQDKATGKPVRN